MRIQVPKDDDEARKVAEYHTLSGWALAGYVASQVRLVGSGRAPENRKSAVFRTAEEFAAQGFRGLRSANTVRLYARRWLENIGEPPAPGAVLDVPDREWPPPPKEEPTPEPTTEQSKLTKRGEPRASRAETAARHRESTTPDPFEGSKGVERLPIEAALDKASHARGQISEKLQECGRLMQQVNSDWSDYEGSINMLIVPNLISIIRVELGVLEFAAGIEHPLDQWRPGDDWPPVGPS